VYAVRLLTIGLLAGSVSRTGPVPPAAPTFNQHVVKPHSVNPAAQPLPTAFVRIGTWGSADPPPPPPPQLQEVIGPRTVQGDPPPFPGSVVNRGTRAVIPGPVPPAALSETTYPANQSFVGPFKEVGDAFYVAILGEADNHVVVMKATADPLVDGNWAGQDEVVVIGAAVKSLWSVLDGTDIHVVTQEANARLGYHKFDTSSDTWTIKDEAVGNTTESAVIPACSIAIRSDGDVIVLYASADGTNQKVHYARREATVWTVDIVVDNHRRQRDGVEGAEPDDRHRPDRHSGRRELREV